MSVCKNLLSTSAPNEFFTVKSDTNKLKPKIDRVILNRDHVLAFVVNIAETSENFLVQINFQTMLTSMSSKCKRHWRIYVLVSMPLE